MARCEEVMAIREEVTVGREEVAVGGDEQWKEFIGGWSRTQSANQPSSERLHPPLCLTAPT